MDKYYVTLIRWCWLIILTAALAAAAAYSFYTYNVAQKYEARSSLYIFKDSIDARNIRVITYNDLLGADLVATDSKSIISSHALLTKVAESLALPLSVIKDGFAVTSGGSARVIVVSSTGVDPERAKIIVEGAISTFMDESESYLPGITFKRLDDVIVLRVRSTAPIYMVGAAFAGACFSMSCILLFRAIRQTRLSRLATKDPKKQTT